MAVTAGNITLSYSPSLSNVTRATTLRECLTGMGATAARLGTLRVPQLLGFLVDSPTLVF